MNIDMAMFHQAFFDEAVDLIADFERDLLVVEEALGDDSEIDGEVLNAIFRCAHSLKGGAATFGFAEIAGFTHGLETLLDRVRNHQIPATRSLAQLLFESLDQMRHLVAAARGEIDFAPDATALTQRIQAAAAATVEDVAQPTEVKEESEDWWGVWSRTARYRLYFKPGQQATQVGSEPETLLAKLLEVVEVQKSDCDATDVPLENPVPGICYFAWTIEFVSDLDRDGILRIFEPVANQSEIRLEELTGVGESAAPAEPLAAVETNEKPAPTQSSPTVSESAPIVPPRSTAGPKPPTASRDNGEGQTLRVSTDKVDKLINLVGELVINQAMLNNVTANFTMDRVQRLVESVASMERACRELQERVMAVRMLPIKHAFGRFPRLVRDTAMACGKQIELTTSGEETELDKTVIEAIADPLTHLVRNSIDHGLETPHDRQAAGKSPTGTVSLHAFQEGGCIVVTVSDDGRGLSRERILAKAIERGLVGRDDNLSDEAVYDLIFEPGFSTAEKVTDLSGRGVGMDIVKRTIQGLNGSVTVTSTPGQGAEFRIRLPLTMAILEGLSVQVGDDVYILPLTSIVESIRPKPSDLNLIAGSLEVVLVRETVLPVVRLYEAFGIRPRITDPSQALLVIIENERKRVALLVDELITQSQVVIKSIETNYEKVNGIAGATIMGDGSVALILDVPAIIRSAHSALNGANQVALHQ